MKDHVKQHEDHKEDDRKDDFEAFLGTQLKLVFARDAAAPSVPLGQPWVISL